MYAELGAGSDPKLGVMEYGFGTLARKSSKPAGKVPKKVPNAARKFQTDPESSKRVQKFQTWTRQGRLETQRSKTLKAEMTAVHRVFAPAECFI